MAKRGTKRPEALYRPLPPGTHGIERTAVTSHQRARIEGAAIQAFVRHGYAKTTLAQIVDLASVSRTTFYQHFKDKQDCFLQIYDQLVERGTVRIARERDAFEDPQQRLRAGLTAFMQLVADEPAAAQLVVVEGLSAGPEAAARHEHVTAGLRGLVGEGLNATPEAGRVSDVTVNAIAGGILRVVGIHLRAGTSDALPGLTDDLLRWALGYRTNEDVPGPPANGGSSGGTAANGATSSSPARSPIPAEPSTSTAGPSAEDDASTSPAGTPKSDPGLPSPTALRQLDHRQRIIIAVTEVVGEKGYPALTIPDISATAGISNQTFYATFKGKEEAFLAAFDAEAARAIDATQSAFDDASAWSDGIGAGLRALLDHLARRPAFARLALVELPAAGDAAQQHWAHLLNAFSGLLRPGRERAPEVPPIILQAISGGVWSSIHRQYTTSHPTELPALAAPLTYVALAPFVGAREAAAVARG